MPVKTLNDVERWQYCATINEGKPCAFYDEYSGCDIHNWPEHCKKVMEGK